MIQAYPLTKANRLLLARAYRAVPRVDLSIPCVVEGQMGSAFADDVQAPTAYKIETGPFAYFAGDATGPGGRALLGTLAPYTLLMPSAPGWLEGARQLYGERLLASKRYSFSPDRLAADYLDRLSEGLARRADVRRIELPLASDLWGREGFVDLSAYDSAEDFIARGVGFCVEKRGRLAGAAYASLVCSEGIEISLFVDEDYRRQGIGTLLACALLQWCLSNAVGPHWDAANPASCRLAEKLGYVRSGDYLAHYLAE